ncbi:universal stress protein [Streptomyces sp. SID8381]|uniref:universal stress protein n=1 Tax=unclassified Streptomyces TaxID=2593676 RepID=UPI00068B2831|nr:MULTISPECIES: universal stress protein [unclassified Streptomyces]MYX27527.1 universal stress protein [Streptomyces sp. SID8381]
MSAPDTSDTSDASDTSSVARVLVGVSGSPGSRTALCRAAVEARGTGAELWPVLAWEPPGGELSARRSPAVSYLVPEWERLARERLLAALDDVFGGVGTGFAGQALIVRGAPGPALVAVADRENDLLVVGAGHRGRLRRALRPSVGRYCLAHAGCAVLAVPPSPLEATLASAHRRNTWRLRLDTGDMEKEFATVPPEARNLRPGRGRT